MEYFHVLPVPAPTKLLRIPVPTATKAKVSCKGCKWQGKSLRGHLRRAETQCDKHYDMELLERDAKEASRQQRSEWELKNRERRSVSKTILRKKKTSTAQNLKDEDLFRDPLEVKDMYGCSICGEAFAKLGLRDLHELQYHSSDGWVERAEYEENRESSSNKENISHMSVASAPEKQGVVCKGCKWSGTSLRRHLRRVDSQCKKFYDMKVLERAALEANRKRNRERIKKRRRIEKERSSIEGDNLDHPKSQGHSSCENDDSRVACDECDKTYSNKDALKRHKSNKHLGLKEYKSCDECDKRYSTRDALKRHKSIEHLGLMEYKCIECPGNFARKDTLDEHMRRGKHYFMFFCPQCKLTMMLRSKFARDKHVAQCGSTSIKLD